MLLLLRAQDTLRTAPLFRYLTSSERESVLEGFSFYEFSEGELIFRQGEAGVSFVLLREGAVKLFHDNGTAAACLGDARAACGGRSAAIGC